MLNAIRCRRLDSGEYGHAFLRRAIGFAHEPFAAQLDFALVSTFQLWQRMGYRLRAALQS